MKDLNVKRKQYRQRYVNPKRAAHEIHRERILSKIWNKCRLIVYCNAFDVHSPITISACDPDFHKHFGHDNFSRFILDDLIGPETSAETLKSVKTSISQGLAISEYLNLYRHDGSLVSCHVTANAITGSLYRADNSKPRDGHRWSVLTIRHAGTVNAGLNVDVIGTFGNANLNEVGRLMVIEEDVINVHKRIYTNHELDQLAKRDCHTHADTAIANSNCHSCPREFIIQGPISFKPLDTVPAFTYHLPPYTIERNDDSSGETEACDSSSDDSSFTDPLKLPHDEFDRESVSYSMSNPCVC